MRTSGLTTILMEKLQQQNLEALSYRRVEAALSDAMAQVDHMAKIGDAIEFPTGTLWRKV
jgi:hypothetical protein